ncbi:MAG: Putative glycosyltransferase [Methanocalculus sp. 52_23]|nr:MAG: Putative glycosyltransferase [Methanocalculus sp. 52_23]
MVLTGKTQDQRGEPPLKVLMVTSSFPRHEGDYFGQFILELAKSLKPNNVEPVILCPHSPGAMKREVMGGVKVYRFPYFYPYSLQRVAAEGGMFQNVKRSPLAKLQLPLFLAMELIYTLWIARKEEIDLLHTHWIVPQGLVGAVCGRLLHCPHILSVHGTDVNIAAKNRVLGWVTKFVTRNCGKILTNSTYTRNVLLSVDPSAEGKVEVIPMGVDVEKFWNAQNDNHKQASNPPHILYIGRLIDCKGLEYLIEAFAIVSRRVPGAQLIIGGEGPEEERLRQQVAHLGLNESVQFIGLIASPDLSRYYHEATVFVLPSIQAERQTEGLGVVLLEAMACGTPVIGSNVGGIPDIIQDGWNGYLVQERSPEALSMKILELIHDTDLSRRLAENGFETVRRKFSWEHVSLQFRDRYEVSISRSLSSK